MPQAPPGSVMVYTGLPLSLTLADDVPLQPAAGAPLRFQVDKELRFGSTVAIAKGAIATGEVVIPRLGVQGRAGRLGFKLLTVEATDGTKLKIRAWPGHNPDRNVQTLETPGYKYKEVLVPAGAKYLGYIDGDQPVAVKQ